MVKQWGNRLFLLFMCTCPLYSMENEHGEQKAIDSIEQSEKNEKLVTLYKKVKKLYQEDAHDSDYKKIIAETHQLGCTANDVLVSRFKHKTKKAITCICNDWRIPSQAMQFTDINEWLKNETSNYGKDTIDKYNLEYPRELEEKALSQDFKEMLNFYIELSGLKDIDVKISEANAFGFNAIEDKDAANSVNCEWSTIKPTLYLSTNFFDYTKNKQKFTLLHEVTHAVLLHPVLIAAIERYCVETRIVESHQETMPNIKEWLAGTSPDVQDKKINEILEQEKEDISKLRDIVYSSDSFKKLSRAKEYEADSFFATLDVEIAKALKDVFLVHKVQEESKKIQTNETESDLEVASTHPSWKKRYEWMDMIVKLLDAEQEFKEEK